MARANADIVKRMGRRKQAVCSTVVIVWVSLLVIAGCGASKSVKRTESPGAEYPSSASTPKIIDVGSLPPEHEVTDRVEIKTRMGNIVVGLYGKDAPDTVANFLGYVDRGFYSGKIFHRVIPGFMVQGGGFDAEMARDETEDTIKLEIIPGLKHEPGIMSMARTSNPHSAASQIFICVGTAPQLNGGYAAFGKVEKGYDVVEAISGLPTKTVETDRGSMADVPMDAVVIESITRI